MLTPTTNADGQLIQNYCSLTPAYGRDYKSKKAIKADFDDNKDFVLQPSGQYINKQQIAPGVTVNIRYNGLRDVYPITVK